VKGKAKEPKLMFASDPKRNDQLDRAGGMVLRAAACDETESEAADSPFLFTRVRAAIAEEQRRREETGGWLSIFFVARRAVPAMALITLLVAILTAWSAQLGAPQSGFDDEALFGSPGAGVEQTVLADNNALSQDDVFNIVVDREYGRSAR
jgi:hypothetical protein